VLVVEDEHLERRTILDGGGHLLDIHLNRGIARDVDNETVVKSSAACPAT
jgi:hypothetical protein